MDDGNVTLIALWQMVCIAQKTIERWINATEEFEGDEGKQKCKKLLEDWIKEATK